MGKSWEVYAETPSGENIPIIKIPDWDFDWQGFYYPEYMQYIPEGSRIEAIATYDNTNDFDMGWGELTTDEMFFCPIYYVPYEDGDENIYLGNNNDTEIEEIVIQDVVLYPSPASEYIDLNFSLLAPGSLQIKIYDLIGREVFSLSEKTVDSGKFTKNLSIVGLESGKYLLDIYFNGKKIEKTFIKI